MQISLSSDPGVKLHSLRFGYITAAVEGIREIDSKRILTAPLSSPVGGNGIPTGLSEPGHWG